MSSALIERLHDPAYRRGLFDKVGLLRSAVDIGLPRQDSYGLSIGIDIRRSRLTSSLPHIEVAAD